MSDENEQNEQKNKDHGAALPRVDPISEVHTEALPIWWWGRPKSKDRHAAYYPTVAALFDHKGRERCTVWSNGTWHTWDENGVGGENDTAQSVTAAKEQATMAVIRQRWAMLIGSGNQATPKNSDERTGAIALK